MSKPTILIVDDEPDILKVLARGLEVLGFSVIAADNGSDAIIIAKDVQPDLVILDVIMPGMDGGEVARRLKELPETKDIPIIFDTTKASFRLVSFFTLLKNSLTLFLFSWVLRSAIC